MQNFNHTYIPLQTKVTAKEWANTDNVQRLVIKTFVALVAVFNVAPLQVDLFTFAAISLSEDGCSNVRGEHWRVGILTCDTYLAERRN